MKYPAVKFVMALNDQQVVTNIFWLHEGKITNTVKRATLWNDELNKILSEGLQSEGRRIQAADGLPFLQALKSRYTGNYFCATDVADVSAEEVTGRPRAR